MTHAHAPRACQQNNNLIPARLPGVHKTAQRPGQQLDCLSPFPKACRANSLASALRQSTIAHCLAAKANPGRAQGNPGATARHTSRHPGSPASCPCKEVLEGTAREGPGRPQSTSQGAHKRTPRRPPRHPLHDQAHANAQRALNNIKSRQQH